MAGVIKCGAVNINQVATANSLLAAVKSIVSSKSNVFALSVKGNY